MVFRHGSQGIHFHPFPSVAPFRADSDGAFPGLKAWAVLLNRFAVNPTDARATLGSVLVLLPSDERCAFAFDDSAVDHHVGNIFAAGHFIHDVEHDLLKHGT